MTFEREEEPRGRTINWLCDEDMLPRVIPQARILAYNYNSNCYSNDAQEVDILGLGESFLETLWIERTKDVGKRPLVFLGSCFGGIVVVQVRLRVVPDKASLLANIGIQSIGTGESLPRFIQVCRSTEHHYWCCISGDPFTRNEVSKCSKMDRLFTRILW